MYERFLPILTLVNKLSQDRYRQASVSLLRKAGVVIDGQPLWISPRTYFDIFEPGCITLGDRCAISHFVKLLTHDYSLDRIAERRLGVSAKEVVMTAPVRIGAQAFVGMGAIILPGVAVGDGAVIGAGSVVTKDVPADTLWAGNPARQIRDCDALWEARKDDLDWQDRR